MVIRFPLNSLNLPHSGSLFDTFGLSSWRHRSYPINHCYINITRKENLACSSPHHTPQFPLFLHPFSIQGLKSLPPSYLECLLYLLPPCSPQTTSWSLRQKKSSNCAWCPSRVLSDRVVDRTLGVEIRNGKYHLPKHGSCETLSPVSDTRHTKVNIWEKKEPYETDQKQSCPDTPRPIWLGTSCW